MTYDNITIRQQIEMEECAEMHVAPFHQGAAKQAYLEGITFEELMKLKTSQYIKIANKYEFLMFPVQAILPKKWQDYPFSLDFNKMQTGDFADLMTLLSAGESKEKIIAKLWMSPEPYEERIKKVYNEMTVPIAAGVNDFFLQWSQNFQANLQLYLAKQAKKEARQTKQKT
jgi:hypothetical protein